MAKLFSSYTSTVRGMIKAYNSELYNFFSEQNIEEVWIDHDNWNGGIDFYNIVISVPVDFFESLRKNGRVEEVEHTINEFYNYAMRGGDESIQIRNIFLRPTAEEIQFLGDNIDDSMWKPGQFRLFISHLTKYKESASNLKLCLSNYGIDCFVAHEDITPSKEWEIEIEKALFTMDALCAIVVPDFVNSQWCDQEVGIALGQRKLVISIDKGQVPYGFFGKYQALKSKNKKANDIALDMWKILSTNERTKHIYWNKLVSLILNATNKVDALKYIDVIKQCETVPKQYIEILHDNLKTNKTLNILEVIKAVNPVFSAYGLSPVARSQYYAIEIDDADLPF